MSQLSCRAEKKLISNKMGYSLILFAACAFSSVYSKQADLPMLTTSCPRSADDLGECFKSSFDKSWPLIVAGVPEFNIPPLDPLRIENIKGISEIGPIRTKYNISNATTYGLANAKLLAADPKIKDDQLHLKIKVQLPKIFQEADYAVDSSGNQFAAGGKGHANVTLSDVTMTVVLDGPIVDDRWNIETIKMTAKIGDMKFWASDLFNGNKALTEAALVFVNQNWKELFDTGLPIAQEFINSWVKDFLNKIMAEVPVSQVFPK